MQRAHVGRERRLIAHRRRNAAEERRHFRAGLREAEDVVDEEQHVLALIAEVLGDGQAGEADAGAGAGRLVHLAVDQRALGAFDRAFMRVLVDARLDHLVIEVVALAGALADAGEHRIAAMRLGHVVDQFHDQHGLADAGTAEQADLAALGVRSEQVDDLDAGDKDRSLGRLIGIGRRLLVDRADPFTLDRTRLVNRIADHVDDPPEQSLPHGNGDRRPGVGNLLTAHQPLAGVHRDRAHGGLAEMLRHLEHQAITLVLGLQCVEDRRQMIVEVHVDDGADDLGDTSDCICHHGPLQKRLIAPQRRR